jgi:hypothetical protein
MNNYNNMTIILLKKELIFLIIIKRNFKTIQNMKTIQNIKTIQIMTQKSIDISFNQQVLELWI